MFGKNSLIDTLVLIALVVPIILVAIIMLLPEPKEPPKVEKHHYRIVVDNTTEVEVYEIYDVNRILEEQLEIENLTVLEPSDIGKIFECYTLNGNKIEIYYEVEE